MKCIIGRVIEMEWQSITQFVMNKLSGRNEHVPALELWTAPEEYRTLDQGAIAGEWLLSARGDDRGILALRSDDADLVYTSFDASQPVDQPGDLRGRETQVAQLVSGVLFRRNHGIISGPRGSGKTSLVRTFGQYTDRDGVVVLYSACDNGTRFGDLMREYLEQIPVSSFEPDMVGLIRERIGALRSDATPNQIIGLLAQVKYAQVIIIADEFDRVSDPDLRWKIASLLKLLSDARISVRFVLVGDASAFDTIVQSHPSLTRHITRVTTDPLDHDAIIAILRDCAARCELTFTDAALDLIEDVACGSPYHARLFGMHASLCAIKGGQPSIGIDQALAGLRRAFAEWALMNPEAGQAIQGVAEGDFGNTEPYARFARSVGRASTDDRDDRASLTAEEQGALAPALERLDGVVTFRDATAPQFLLALCRSAEKIMPLAKKVAPRA